MPELDLLKALPKSKRNIKDRRAEKDPEVIRISKQYGEMYFDGPRKYGYGGYKYDGRWQPVASDIIKHYKLKPGHRVLDIGCAKGFLVKDLLQACPGLEVFGVDISEYAIKHCEPEVIGRLHRAPAHDLPFPDHVFDLVFSINAIHNYDREGVKKALQEAQRVGKGNAFVQVDSYLDAEEKQQFEDWVLTAQFHDYPKGWVELFKEAGYNGDYFWTRVI